MAIPLAFINGLFFAATPAAKIRQYWEGGPMDVIISCFLKVVHLL